MEDVQEEAKEEAPEAKEPVEEAPEEVPEAQEPVEEVQEAPKKRGPGRPKKTIQKTQKAKWTLETLPLKKADTLAKMQKFAKKHKAEIGGVPKPRTKDAFWTALLAALRS